MKAHPRPLFRALAMLLTLAMLFSLMSTAAFAEDAQPDLVITNADEFAAFAAAVKGGTTYADKLVVLDADISGITTQVGASTKAFDGTFDGQGHTLTLAISGTTMQGLFVRNNGTIRNLCLEGTVSGSTMGGGLVVNNYGTIESVVSRLMCTFSNGNSGAIAYSNRGLIRNCINAGDLLGTTATTTYAGIVYQNTNLASTGAIGTVQNCYNVGSIGPDGGSKCFAIAGTTTNGVVENCYYLAGTASAGDANAVSKTSDEMKTTDFVLALGDAFHYLEGQYPCLAWQGGTPVGGEHTHVMGDWAPDEDGENHIRFCTACEDYSETEPHAWDEGTVTQEPTTTAEGIMTYTCTVCSGTKTETIPMLEETIEADLIIRTAADFEAFAAEVAAGNSFEGKVVALANDIDLGGSEEHQTPMAGMYISYNSANAFAGTFDGMGHTISGIYFNDPTAKYHGGLFGPVSGTVKNLTARGTVSANLQVGGIAYQVSGTLENCHSYVNVTSNGVTVGGIAGVLYKNTGVIRNCSNFGTVTSNAGSNSGAGGIVGSMQAATRIEGCFNAGPVTGKTPVGGIAASAGAATAVIENCYNLGAVTAANDNSSAGGIVGSTFATIINCYNAGFISNAGTANTGAILGFNSQQKAVITNCYYLDTSAGYAFTYNDVLDETGKLTEAQMTDTDLADSLGEAYKFNPEGYPLLTWQDGGDDTPVVRYTVTFMDGETVLSTTTVREGKTVLRPNDPAKPDHRFLYWATEEGGTAYDFTTPVSADLTLYAQWKAVDATWDYELIDNDTAVKITKYKGGDTVVVIPDTLEELPVTTLGAEVFTGNTSIMSVRMSNNITTVENGTDGLKANGTFRGCTKLTTVFLSKSLTRIADYMFYGVASGTSYALNINWDAAPITAIGDFAFACCNNIVELHLPVSVTHIGAGAFYQSRRLAVLDMPGVTNVEMDAFTETIFEERYEDAWKAGEFSGVVYADKVAYLYMAEDNETRAMAENTEIILADGTLGISEFLLANHYVSGASVKTNLLSVTVPGTVSYIAPSTFEGCKAVEDGDFTGIDFYGISGSAAETYADANNNIRFNSIGTPAYDWKNAEYDWYDKATSRSYEISNLDELRAFEDLLDSGEEDFVGATVTLAADIDLGGITQRGGYGISDNAWTPVSYMGNSFAGTFDGGNHTISGVYMNCAMDHVGFFDKLPETAVVKNLNLSGKVSGWDNVGGVVGSAFEGAVIENCSFTGSVKGNSTYGYVGGIVGNASKTEVTGCTVNGTVSCTVSDPDSSLQLGYTGGIVGLNNGGTVTDCINNAAVTGNGFGIGGITGQTTLGTVTDCVNNGTVLGHENVGGISGKLMAALLQNCTNNGPVSGDNRIGGGAGFSVGVTTDRKAMFGCVNFGTVTAKNHAGGIVGYVHDSVAEHCANYGAVTAAQFAGGIGGYVLGGWANDCYNRGDITATDDYAAGIEGMNADAESTMENCYNSGSINAFKHNEPLANIYNDQPGHFENCYVLTEENAPAFASGEVAYLLGEAYGQIIGADDLPVFRTEENAVYQHVSCDGETVTYTNDASLSGQADHVAEVRDTVEPTCVENGYTGDTWCTVCGQKLSEGETIAALSHDYDAIVTAPTCTEAGYTTYTCTRCEDTYTADETEPLGHTWDEGTVTVPATEEAEGEMTYICTACGETKTEVIPVKSCRLDSYTDVNKDAWYHAAVDFVVENGIMQGVSETAFSPKSSMTRAQMAQILYNLEGKPACDAENPFVDVKASSWYAKAVIWAAANGIVSGTGNGCFAPNESLTREQAVTMLYRYAKAEPVDGDAMTAFPDAAKVASWAVDAMNWAVTNGIVNGSGGKLLPKNTMTRAEMAQLMMNYHAR